MSDEFIKIHDFTPNPCKAENQVVYTSQPFQMTMGTIIDLSQTNNWEFWKMT